MTMTKSIKTIVEKGFTPMQENRLDELDILRALGFIFVVAQHILGGYAWRQGMGIYDSVVLNLLYVVAKPAVPIFVTLVAITLFYSTGDKKLDVFKFYSKKVKFIVTPYIIWSLVIILLTKKFDNILGVLITGNADYHLWYMGMFLRILLYFPITLLIVNMVREQNKTVRTVLLIIFCICYWLLMKNNITITDSIISHIFKNPSKLESRFVTITPILWSIYFVLGLKIFFNYAKFVKHIIIYKSQIFSVYILLLAYVYYAEFRVHIILKEPIFVQNAIIYFDQILNISYMCISIVVFYILSLYISKKKEKVYAILKYIAHYSYSGYLMHTIILARVANEITWYIPASLVSGLIIFSITVYLSIKLPYLLSYLPYSEYLLGTKRIKNKVNNNSYFDKFVHRLSGS